MKTILLPFLLFTLVFCGNACQINRLPERLPERSPHLFLPCKAHLSPEGRRQVSREKQGLRKANREKTGKAVTRFAEGLHPSEALDLTGNLTP